MSHESIGKLVDISSNLNLLKGPTWDLLILDLSLRVARFSISPSGRGHINIINGCFTQSLTPSATPFPSLGNRKQITRRGARGHRHCKVQAGRKTFFLSKTIKGQIAIYLFGVEHDEAATL